MPTGNGGAEDLELPVQGKEESLRSVQIEGGRVKSRSSQCWTCRYSIAKPIGSGIRTVIACAAAEPPSLRVEMYEDAKNGECQKYERCSGCDSEEVISG